MVSDPPSVTLVLLIDNSTHRSSSFTRTKVPTSCAASNRPPAASTPSAGPTTANHSFPSRKRSSVVTNEKLAVPLVEPAGMATVKSGTVVKSSGPATPPVTATPAGPPATDTATAISSVGTAGSPAPPKPTNSAVTVTVVEAPSFTALGLTLNCIRLSSSKINNSSPNTSQPAATPDTPADSEPSNKASSAPVSQKLPVPLVEPAGMAIVKSSTAPPVPRPW